MLIYKVEIIFYVIAIVVASSDEVRKRPCWAVHTKQMLSIEHNWIDLRHELDGYIMMYKSSSDERKTRASKLAGNWDKKVDAWKKNFEQTFKRFGDTCNTTEVSGENNQYYTKLVEDRKEHIGS